ncbi:DUF2809 domain-containing protein [soil metagenome]
MSFAFNLKYLFLTILIFVVEVFIALFVKDTIVRPFVGDVLVVVLIYCFFRIFLKINYWKTALGVFLFTCLIEVLQYFDYVALLHLENSRVISVILGRTFEWMDFVAYFAGFLFIIITERFFLQQKFSS